ncbi:MAG: NAD(P)H-hydrate dehydratase [Acidobacteria bacterium]|nr:NAD(P)H-hydrate dehydratase [Acidobacteriota bacterium]
MRVLTAAESRAFDRRAIDEIGLPGPVLMENAALAVVESLVSGFPEVSRVAIVCGPGNNGGDGFAVARHLATRGYEVELGLDRFGRDPSTDCAAQIEICRRIGLEVRDLGAEESIDRFADAPLLVDALFGTGLTRPLEGEVAARVAALGRGRAPRLAVDLPSGLDADRAKPVGPVLRADRTVTFVALKPAHVLPPAADLCGEVAVADLGLPAREAGGAGALHLLVSEEVAAWMPPRAAGAHKGTFGQALLVAGSRALPGASILAARAAVRGGAGLVTVAAPRELGAALAAASPESMQHSMAQTEGGGADFSALEGLLAAAAARTAVAVGPGMGRDAATIRLIERFVLDVGRPLVLDADGLAPFEGAVDRLRERRAATVLTPHPGELARLLGTTVEAIEDDRLVAVRDAAERSGAVVVLKGRRTLVAAPDGEVWINATGGPALASGGSGDVLTGLLLARLAQGNEPAIAAAVAVHLHGVAGDLAAERSGGPAVPAGDLAEAIPAAYRRVAST